jgi:GT2 family glycosyltransferase
VTGGADGAGDASAADPVSVVIPHFGDRRPTLDLATALLGDPPPGGVEVIVVDDRSPQPFPPTDGVVVHRCRVNGGFGRAANAGVRLATHPWLLILNSDIVVPPGFLTSLLAAAAPLQPAVVGVRQRDPETQEELRAGHRFFGPLSLAVLHTSALRRYRGARWWRRLARTDDEEPAPSGPVDWISGAVLLLPLRLFVRLGGFDESYFMYCEEVDLQRQAHQRGVPSLIVTGIEVGHHGGASSSALDVPVEQLTSQYHYLRRWEGPAATTALTVLLTGSIALDLVVDTARRATGRPASPLATAHRRYTAMRRARRGRRTEAPT